MAAIDVAKARRETPGADEVIHFNNAGAALMPQRVVDAIVDHVNLEAMRGGYEAAALEHQRIEHTYDAIATLINCDRDEVAVVENATRAWDMAFYSIPFAPGDRILTAVSEYGSNYIAYLQTAKKYGVQIEVVPNDEHGQLSIEALQAMLDDRVKLISVTHIPTNGGLVNPAREIGEVARQAGVLYLLDACQSVGQLPVDVEEIGCDILSATGRKYLRGPRGTGFLYVRKQVLEQLEPVFLDNHAAEWTTLDSYEVRPDARRFENWETNYSTKLGLAESIDYALEWGMDVVWERVLMLGERLREQLSELPGVQIADLGEVRGGIVTFAIEGLDVELVKPWMLERNINVVISNPPSTRIDMEDRGLNALVRASVHYYNTEEELETFVAAMGEYIANAKR